MLELSNLQSIFQLFTGIYLATEWLSIENIILQYKKNYEKELKGRLKRASRYSNELLEIYQEYEQNGSNIIKESHLIDVTLKFRKISKAFFFISLFFLIASSFYPKYTIDIKLSFSLVLLLASPFIYAYFSVYRRPRKIYKYAADFLIKELLPIEHEENLYRQLNPAPDLNSAYIKRDNGDSDAFKKHFKDLRKYNENLLEHMKNKFSNTRSNSL